MAWITTADVVAFLGAAPSTATDQDWLAQATAAADTWAQTERARHGYTDDPDTAPGPDAKAGTTMLAADVYRSRGATDAQLVAAFDAAAYTPAPSVRREALRLLGIPRPAAA